MAVLKLQSMTYRMSQADGIKKDLEVLTLTMLTYFRLTHPLNSRCTLQQIPQQPAMIKQCFNPR